MIQNGENYIRFDWAMKRLLRNKANYVVLEGFLSSLIGKGIKIHRFLESESTIVSISLQRAKEANSALLKCRIAASYLTFIACYMECQKPSQNTSV